MKLHSLVPLVLLVVAGTAYTVDGYVQSREPDPPAYDHRDLGAEFGVRAAPGAPEAFASPAEAGEVPTPATARRCDRTCPLGRGAESPRPWADPGPSAGS